ncbi:MAG TPA: GNAT family N-acetyltransferase [Nocardioidaceae bacterium]|nr:GNAT family N-acetyltransferase [Nocardioidaceae bacterium]
MTLGPRDVGRRVVVRYLLEAPQPGASATDVVGLLVAYHADGLEIETRTGDRVRIPALRVVAAKPVPPRPPARRQGPDRRIDADALQRIGDLGWPARTRQRLGEWVLREAAGFTGRANSALALGDPGLPLDDALMVVQAFYDDHDLPALVQAVLGAEVEGRLLDAGWEIARHQEGVLVQVTSMSRAGPAGRPARGPEVELLDAPTEEWMSVYARAADVPADVVVGVLAGPPVTAFAAVGAGRPGGPVAIGRGVVTGDWLGLSAVEVVPSRRREGLARRIVDALLDWGAGHGAEAVYLQTLPDNSAALRLYGPYGFVTHHRYRYLAPGSGARGRPGPGQDRAH